MSLWVSKIDLKGKFESCKKGDIKENQEKNMPTIKQFGVKRTGISGSGRSNELKENSDIDSSLNLKDAKLPLKWRGLIDFLEDLFGRERDLLTPEGIETIKIKYIREEI